MDKTVVFIPVIGGNEFVHLRNIKVLCGKPLVYWTVKAACEAELVDKVYVVTDSHEITNTFKEVCEKEKDLFSKLKVIDRLEENLDDRASAESVMLEFACQYEFENIILLQITSPLLQGKDIDGGVRVFELPDTDSVISLVRQKRFLWQEDEGIVSLINYDVKNRPIRQNLDGYLMENGAFYITSRDNFLKNNSIISGRIRPYILPEETAVEIEEEADFVVLENLLKKHLMSERTNAARNIKMVVTDCDGCLTDGGMYYSENGDELKKFNAKDGMALVRAREKGIIVGIITGEKRELNQRRAEKLNVDFIEQGVKDKLQMLKSVCTKFNVKLEEVLYIGDDINDLSPMKESGYSACPADAAREVLDIANHVSTKKGGDGAVREIMDWYF